MHLPSELGPAHPTPVPRGLAAPVAKLHPARTPPTPSQEACGAEDCENLGDSFLDTTGST
jgi:hypothetical protein